MQSVNQQPIKYSYLTISNWKKKILPLVAFGVFYKTNKKKNTNNNLCFLFYNCFGWQ